MTPPQRHHQREDDRQQPDRRRPEERAPQTDRHHRHHVIGPEQRMREAADETAGHAAGVGEGGRAGQEHQRERRRNSAHAHP